MICKVLGKYLESGIDVRNVEGKSVERKFVLVYSGQETIKIYDFEVPEGTKGFSDLEIVADVKMREWNGRKYLQIQPLE